jgi:hypothetical protein
MLNPVKNYLMKPSRQLKKQSKVYVKCSRVIASCVTLEQLKVCKAYLLATYDYVSYPQYSKLHDMYFEARLRLLNKKVIAKLPENDI